MMRESLSKTRKPKKSEMIGNLDFGFLREVALVPGYWELVGIFNGVDGNEQKFIEHLSKEKLWNLLNNE